MTRGSYDVAVIGAGAAGLMAAIFASRAGVRVVALDGAARIGAKILISGGGRCNVTHDVIRPEDFNGNRNAIARVLRTFDVPATVAFFEELGVRLKREETGKLFPVTDKARTVVDALLRAAEKVDILTGHKVEAVERGFRIGDIEARRVVIATGGRSVPKSGSDGSGYAIVRSLGHTVTPVFPALVPLVLDHPPPLSGTSVEAELSVRSETGRVLHRERGPMLFTHFGISGPAVLDISRHWIAHQPATLHADFMPGVDLEQALIEEAKRNPHTTVANYLKRSLPSRLVDVFVNMQTTLGRLSREERREVVREMKERRLAVTRDRGFDYAEVTAGGVPLKEIDLSTMQSRTCEGLYLCGEILDVDGKIGGYNFQWAWASGRLAGLHAARFA
ncbi:MAG TPA: NAD(P)/FAD-dependent oxidoreductase [Thermoanaerobaculia bacterium]|nr:NAD(P)/FAD-dependent oxidoreductase [Thermoanaerobaculia bacterium]